jgi:hypothetical protein
MNFQHEDLEKAETIRYPSVAMLCVDTADAARYVAVDSVTQPYYRGFRVDDTVPSDVYINKQGPLLFGYMTRIALTEVNFTWDIPNINERNNTLTIALWDISSGVTPPTYPAVPGARLLAYRRLELAEKYYTLAEAADALQAALNADVGSYIDPSGTSTMDWEVDMNPIVDQSATIQIRCYTLSGTRKIGFQIIKGGIQRAKVATDPSGYTIDAVEDDLTFPLGLQPAVSSESGISAIVSDVVLSSYAGMQYTNYIDIVSKTLTKYQNVADNDSGLKSGGAKLARIYLSNEAIQSRVTTADYTEEGVLTDSYDDAIGVRPFAFRREFKFPKQILWNNTENIDSVDIQVLDRLGNVLYSNQTQNQSATFNPGSPLSPYGLMVTGNNTSFQFTIQVTEA